MRFKTEIRTRKVKLTIDGREEEVDQKYEEHVPVLPRDWDDISTKVGFGLVGILTLISVVWSTVSIGSLLGGGVGFLAALLFDVSWAVCLLLEWKSRYDSTKRAFPRTLGWLLLIATMAFIGWHGLQQNNVALAVVGACVSLFAKVLWLGIMKHIDRNLSDEHRQWVTKTISEANARMAVAQVMRQVARMEDDAVAQRLAIEFSRTRYAHTPVHTVDSTVTVQPTLGRTGDHTQPVLPVRTAPTVQPEFEEDETTPPASVEMEYEGGKVEYDHSLFATGQRHEPVVYFVRNGDRIKIGTSTNLSTRIKNLGLRMSNVVRVEYGGAGYERAVHQHFDEYRIGNTEWFLLEGDLAEYVGIEYDDSTGEYDSYGLTLEPNTAHTASTVRPTLGPYSDDSAPALRPEFVAQGYDRETAIAEMVKMIKDGNGPSYNEAERMFGRPKSTVVGWVKAARREAGKP